MIEKADTDEWIDLLIAKYQRMQDDNRSLESTVDRLIDRIDALEHEANRLDDRVWELERG